MRFSYCPKCGTKLVEKVAGDEGEVPYCLNCQKYWFEMFSDASIILVANELNEIVLLRQGYISDKYCTFVSGYIKPGETAEETAFREVEEEVGLTLESLENDGTFWFPPSEVLMHCFIGRTKKRELTLSQEVDQAFWTPVQDVGNFIFPESPENACYKMWQRFIKKIKISTRS